ncbi:acyl carrier protein [Phaeospirillum tilakii]|uniref:Acyl carrier protein n=1 Tax=Phaeospirillum tilakii TaxID=741673 RepID=A0ABW5CEZ3_9PROT
MARSIARRWPRAAKVGRTRQFDVVRSLNPSLQPGSRDDRRGAGLTQEQSVSVHQQIIDYFAEINPAALDGPVNPELLKVRRLLDSFQMLDFLLFLEKSFHLKIDDAQLLGDDFETIGKVVSFVERHQNEEK